MNCQNQTNIQKFATGKWKKTQHEKFMKALEKYGRNWAKIQQVVKTRSISQVRSHAQKVFSAMSEEDLQALDESIDYGQSEISSSSDQVYQSYTSTIIIKKQKPKINLVDAFMDAIQSVERQQKLKLLQMYKLEDCSAIYDEPEFLQNWEFIDDEYPQQQVLQEEKIDADGNSQSYTFRI